MDAGVLLRRERIQKSAKSMPTIIAHCVLVTGYVNCKFFLGCYLEECDIVGSHGQYVKWLMFNILLCRLTSGMRNEKMRPSLAGTEFLGSL
jgi:hypothetical protein